jgi:hypothetical protein
MNLGSGGSGPETAALIDEEQPTAGGSDCRIVAKPATT